MDTLCKLQKFFIKVKNDGDFSRSFYLLLHFFLCLPLLLVSKIMLVWVKDHHIPQNISFLMLLRILCYFWGSNEKYYVLNNWQSFLVSPSGLEVQMSLLSFQTVQEAHHKRQIVKCSRPCKVICCSIRPWKEVWLGLKLEELLLFLSFFKRKEYLSLWMLSSGLGEEEITFWSIKLLQSEWNKPILCLAF